MLLVSLRIRIHAKVFFRKAWVGDLLMMLKIAGVFSIERARSSRRGWSRALPLFAAIFLLGVSCSEQDWGAPGASISTACVDSDRDTYGVGCASGPDCDDRNANIFNNCGSEEINCDVGEPQTGCLCENPGDTHACGKITVDTERATLCNEGMRTCGSTGVWSECRIIFAESSGLAGLSLGRAPRGGLNPIKMGLGEAQGCPSNSCDAYCKVFPDEADDTLSGNGIIFDGGLTVKNVPATVNPDGPIDSKNVDILTSAGKLPADPYIYHELVPGGDSEGPDPVSLTAQLNFIDIYFDIDTSWTMGPAVRELGSSVGGATGIIQTVRARFPNARFGVGHFHGYQMSPHGDLSNPISMLNHSLDLTTDDSATADVISWLSSNGVTRNRNKTEGFVVSIFSVAQSDVSRPNLGPYLYRGQGADPSDFSDPANFWVTPRNGAGAVAWASDYDPTIQRPCPNPAVLGASGAAVGYPCFSPTASKILVAMTDNPGENGPGGSFAYGHPSAEPVFTSTLPIQGGTTWPNAINIDSQNNNIEANAVTIDPTAFARYRGTFNPNGAGLAGTGARSAAKDGSTTRGFSQPAKNFPTTAKGTCRNDDGKNSPEAYFEFTLTDTEYLNFDTYGSETDTVLYVVDRSNNKRVMCGDTDDWVDYGRKLNRAAPGTHEQASIRGLLAPGDYYLVVDSKKVRPDIAASSCDSGYDLVSWAGGESCLKYVNTISTWNTANAACAGDGASMISEPSDAKKAAIAAATPSGFVQRYWLGLEYDSVDARWEWQTSPSSSAGGLNWESGHPKSRNTCSYRKGSGLYRSYSCSRGGLRSICEMAPALSSGGEKGFFLQMNAMDDEIPIGVPSWENSMAALNDGGYKVIGIDVSGMGPITTEGGSVNPYFDRCDTDYRTNRSVDGWTYPHLHEAARRTGAIDSSNSDWWSRPYVLAMNRKGKPCKSGDDSMAKQVSDAILSLTQNVRQDVVFRTLDTDDLTDFDYSGTASASPPQLTPYPVDEGPAPSLGRPYGLFVDRVAVVPVVNGTNGSHDLSPDGITRRCLDDPSTVDVIEACLPDTAIEFSVTFSAPDQLDVLGKDQIFNFEVTAQADGAVLASKDVVIVIPRSGSKSETFNRDFDLTDVCEQGFLPLWGLFTWQASTPGDSQIKFYIKTAETLGGLDSAKSVPTGDGFAVAASSSANGGMIQPPLAAVGDTQTGAQLLDSILEASGEPQTNDFLRVEAVLVPGKDGFSVPTLIDWEMQVSCPPGE